MNKYKVNYFSWVANPNWPQEVFADSLKPDPLIPSRVRLYRHRPFTKKVFRFWRFKYEEENWISYDLIGILDNVSHITLIPESETE